MISPLVGDAKKLDAIERFATTVLPPEALPGIDIQPLLDALMQFLMQLLDDCPEQQIRRAADQSARRPVIGRIWRMNLARRLPEQLRQIDDLPANLLDAGAKMTDDQWAAVR